MYDRFILQIKAWYYSIRRRIGPVTIRDNFGIKMRLYPFDHLPIKKLLTRENYKYEFSMYDRYAPGKVVIDAGANIGVHSVYLSHLATTVYAFEPVPRTFAWLQETIRLNDRANIVPVNSALGDAAGTVEMQIFVPGLSGWNSIHIPTTEEAKPVTTQIVPITTLDVFAKENNLERIGFMKIDVEGHELAILQGAHQLLSEARIDVLSFEVTAMHITDATPLFDLLKSYGYTTTEPYVPSEHDVNYYALSGKVSSSS